MSEQAIPATLSAALEREHRQIDGGIETFAAGLSAGKRESEPLAVALAGLRRHIYLEEVFLFPPLREIGMTVPIFVMMREHGELWDSMDELEELLASDATPEAVLAACAGLLEQLDDHNSKEEPVIYPKADDVLSATATDALQAFLADGRTPARWVCARASASDSLA